MDASYKVFVLPNDLSGNESSLKLLKLKHPRTGSPICCFLGPNGMLYEIVSYSEKYSSWFFGDLVVEDGKMHLVTPLDPLFMILPYLYKEVRFCPLEDILVDESFPDAKYLQKCCQHDDLQNITKSKDAMNITVYSYDDSNTLNWLKKKVKQVSTSLREKKICVSDGSTADNYTSGVEATTIDSFERTACHLLSEYLPEDLAEKLCCSCGFTLSSEEEEKEENPMNQQQKKGRKAGDVAPIEDYSNGVSSSIQDKTKTKLTSSQKKLQKADKTGMKNISSFFQKK